MATTLTEFVNQHQEQYVNYDNYAGPQCVDLYRVYVRDVLDQPQTPLVVYAKDIWDAPGEFERVAYAPGTQPARGDIVIWGAEYGPQGHVAICTEADAEAFVCFSQNDPTGSTCIVKTYASYAGVLGWLKANYQDAPATQPDLILGMDSSKWDDDPTTAAVPDFAQAYAAGAKYNYLRAKFGLSTDVRFVRDWKNCRKTPMLLGSYCFLVWDVSPRTQAERYWELVRNDPGELPLICDFEWWGTMPRPDVAMDKLYDFLETMKRLTNHPLGIYTGRVFWRTYGGIAPYWRQYHLWLASYNDIPFDKLVIPHPWTEVFLWQYTSKGDGLRYGMESKEVDLNWMPRKYYEQFGGKPPEPPAHQVFIPIAIG